MSGLISGFSISFLYRQWIKSAGLVLLLATSAVRAQVTTPQILATTVAGLPSCLDYCFVGVCFWLRCTPFGCTTETTLRIKHNNPDIVASVYDNAGQNPWVEMLPISQAANLTLLAQMGPLASGGRSTGKRSTHEDLLFKEAELMGSPAQLINNTIIQAVPYVCPSESTPYFPYFLSETDAFAWRSGLTELVYPATYIPGLREVGLWPIQTWGSVHPRQGFLVSPEEPKMAAVTAQRAADIITRSLQPHVYRKIRSFGLPRHVDTPGPTHEKTDQWQMISPVPGQCSAFGRDPTYAEGRGSAHGDFVFQLWRPYTCCIPDPGAVYLFSVEVPVQCPNLF